MTPLELCQQKMNEIFNAAELPFISIPHTGVLYQGLTFWNQIDEGGQRLKRSMHPRDALLLGEAFNNAGIPVRKLYEEQTINLTEEGEKSKIRGPFIALQTYFQEGKKPTIVMVKGQRFEIANDIAHAVLAFVSPSPNFITYKKALLTHTMQKAFANRSSKVVP